MRQAFDTLVRRVATVAGPVRTDRNNRWLAAGLAFTAGMVNSVGFLAVAIYTSHMTGLVSTAADQLVLGGYYWAWLAALGLFSFICGAAACALLFNWGRRNKHISKFALVLWVEALAILLVGLLADLTSQAGLDWGIVMVLAWIMGLQNGLITKISDAQIRTTHVTGMVTDIGIEMGKWLYLNPKGDEDPVKPNFTRLKLHILIVSMFFFGGVFGALLGTWIGFYTVLPAAAILLVLAFYPVYVDFRYGKFRPSKVFRRQNT